MAKIKSQTKMIIYILHRLYPSPVHFSRVPGVGVDTDYKHENCYSSTESETVGKKKITTLQLACFSALLFSLTKKKLQNLLYEKQKMICVDWFTTKKITVFGSRAFSYISADG